MSEVCTPQIAHMLFKGLFSGYVDNLCIICMLRRRNDPVCPFFALYVWTNLPTMKSQLSQLPLIVGSGRVAIRRALFSCLLLLGL
jgi:hypothetical protein